MPLDTVRLYLCHCATFICDPPLLQRLPKQQPTWIVVIVALLICAMALLQSVSNSLLLLIMKDDTVALDFVVQLQFNHYYGHVIEN